MREQKYRAWDKEKKKYVFGIEYFDLYAPLEYEDLSFSDFLNDENFDVEQYIELQDITGKEVYEGDKFKIIHTMYIVCFNEGKFYLEIEDIYNIGHAKILDIVNCKDFEIIGNIHENRDQSK